MRDDGATALTRRSFLALAAGAFAVACGPAPPYDRKRFAVASRSAVGLFPASYSSDLADVIGRGLGELNVSLKGKRVVLKPNMVEYEPGTSINTHPLVVAGAAT